MGEAQIPGEIEGQADCHQIKRQSGVVEGIGVLKWGIQTDRQTDLKSIPGSAYFRAV